MIHQACLLLSLQLRLENFWAAGSMKRLLTSDDIGDRLRQRSGDLSPSATAVAASATASGAGG
jgi:hypothetical protein